MKLIAETAWHHEGDFLFMKNLLNKIVNNTKADIVKLHITLNLDEYMDHNHNSYNTIKSMLFNKDQWKELICIIKKSQKELMLLLNDTSAIEFAVDYKPEYVELHSVCLNVPYLQDMILKKFDLKTKIAIGVGGCDLREINNALNVFKDRKIILMFGFQNYPTRLENINLKKIKKIQNLHPNNSFGYADHTSWNEDNNELISLLVTSNRMEYLEKHVTIEYGKQRTDFESAISIDMFNSLHQKLEILKKINGDGILEMNEGEKKYSEYGPMKMAALSNNDLELDHYLSLKDIYFRRIKNKTDLSQIDILEFIGKKLSRPIHKNEVFNSTHFSNLKKR